MNNYIYEQGNKRYKICSECGQKQVEWKERLTKGLVRSLVKFHHAIRIFNKNDINIHKELEKTQYKLTHSEKCNWTKLRYHGLIFKKKDAEGNVLDGRFGLTQRGYDFLHKGISVPAYVWSYDHRLSDAIDAHSEERVTLTDVVKMEVFFDTIDDFESREHDDGQGKLL